MELDDLKIAWQSLDRRLAEQNSQFLEWGKERKLSSVKSALRPALIGNLIQLLVGLALEFLFAPFWVQHLDTPYLLFSGLLLHGYALMFVIYAAREITMILGLDYSGSVLAIQKQLNYLQAWRQRMAPHLGIVGSVIWIPLVLVTLSEMGIEITLDDPTVLLWLVSSLLVSFAVLFALAKWAHIFGDSAVGPNLLRAQTMLDELAQFEQE